MAGGDLKSLLLSSVVQSPPCLGTVPVQSDAGGGPSDPLDVVPPLELLGQSCICLKGRECFTGHTEQDSAKELSFPRVPGFCE